MRGVVGVLGVLPVVVCACVGAGTQKEVEPARGGVEEGVAALVPVNREGTGSTIALAMRGKQRLALVADEDSRAVRAVDVQTGVELGRTDLPGTPGQLVVGRDGRVFVAIRDGGEVDELSAGATADGFPMRVARRATTAAEPVGLALSKDGRTLLVTCGWGHALDALSIGLDHAPLRGDVPSGLDHAPLRGDVPSGLDHAPLRGDVPSRSLEQAWRVDVAREPRAVVLSDDGTHAYVSHAAASLVSVVDLDSERHDIRLVSMKQPSTRFDGEAEEQWRQGYALAKTDSGILAAGVLVNTGDTTVRTETYGGSGFETLASERFTVANVDAHDGETGRAAANERFEVRDVATNEGPPSGAEACLLPRAMAFDPQGQWVFLTCDGSGLLHRAAFAGGRWNTASGSWRVGREPTGIALDPNRRTAFVWSQADRVVTAVPTDGYRAPGAPADDSLVQTYALGIGEIIGDETKRLGRELFHLTGDPNISSDGRACASCHPDGRDDGLVWATPDGPRQTPTLAGRLAGTAPYGWNGARDTVKKHVTSTLKRLGGTGLDDEALDALVDYCNSMPAPPRDVAAKSASPDLLAQGRDLFDSPRTGCASCHMDDGTFTDGNRHDVKSRAAGDPGRSFDTPSLRFVAGTAPYFHDARYPTLRALLAGSDGRMGHTRSLSPHELDALEAYLRTL